MAQTATAALEALHGIHVGSKNMQAMFCQATVMRFFPRWKTEGFCLKRAFCVYKLLSGLFSSPVGSQS